MNDESTKPPITNCHTHIFKGEHVPPFIAKTFIPFVYWILHLPTILKIFEWSIYVKKSRYNYQSFHNKFRRFVHFLNRGLITRLFYQVIGLIFGLNALYLILIWLSSAFQPIKDLLKKVEKYTDLLHEYYVLFPDFPLLLQVLFVIVVLTFFKTVRKAIWAAVKLLLKIPGKKIKELGSRYILLGRYTLYERQHNIFNAMQSQYPKGTRFVVLPMDMEFMGAGKLRKDSRYENQMQDLVKIKNSSDGPLFEPFVFIDPRRIEKEPNFFRYTFNQGKVELEDCTVKKYIEDEGFSGFKIYPALGYYPFDELLLPLWLYAAQHQIPIMTHCIGGTIFYRGKKKQSWHSHPVFQEADGLGGNVPLQLPQRKNINFSINFTHPLNYLCLLEERLLRILVKDSSPEVQRIFGFTDSDTSMERNLSKLKVCMAHFGGEEEWVKYLESDRDRRAQELIQDRNRGLEFWKVGSGEISWAKLSNIWKYSDWYSIITGMINQYENVYADISYILSKPRILPLLKETVDPELNPHLSKRVLFGTDFYVVRNHFSEKDLLAQMMGGLSEERFDQIARYNPITYLAKQP